SYLQVANEQLRRTIIKEWEQATCIDTLKEQACAICGRATSNRCIVLLNPNHINLALLRNDDLPLHARPTNYSLTAYDGAILCADGLTRTDVKADMRTCKECAREIRKRKRMPKFALANWLYYGYDSLPNNVRDAFKEATYTERVLISRARASKISFRFSEKPGHNQFGTDPRGVQGYVHGNVAIHPQDATHLNEVLPPSQEVVRDMICAIFLSGDKKVTADNVRDLKPEPMLARKARVQLMIEFLIRENSHYQVSNRFRGFSQQNLDSLFEPGQQTTNESIPCGIEIGCVQSNQAVEASTEGYVPSEHPQTNSDEIIMDSVGYLHSDDTPLDTNQMKAYALKHCLSGGTFVQSRAGSRFVPDFENSSLLSWLFPHLDPWGIGGFFEPRRTRPLSLDEQLKYLMHLKSSPFKTDPDFAFVYYNIKQKKAVFDSVTFRVPANQRENIVSQLLAVNVEKLDVLSKKLKENAYYQPDDIDEKNIIKLLARINAVSHDVPGSNGYKLTLRNQIRSLIYKQGPPTLFVTLNPSDIHHPLVQMYAGHEISETDILRGQELSHWQRQKLVAQNPDACAKFFHTMISKFVEIVLRYGRPGKGLFG
ncbi:hypothetical protein C8Q76DRAFT_584759, partial [Earliella scabrosa]